MPYAWCQAPVSRSTSRRSCQTAGARRHTDHADAVERHRFHHIACYRSGGTFPIGWNPPNRANPHRRREHASAMTDDRSARHSQHLSAERPRKHPNGRQKHTPRPTPSAARERQRHRRLPRRCLRPTPNQHVLSILQVGSHQLQYRFFRTNKPKSRHKTNMFCPTTLNAKGSIISAGECA